MYVYRYLFKKYLNIILLQKVWRLDYMTQPLNSRRRIVAAYRNHAIDSLKIKVLTVN